MSPSKKPKIGRPPLPADERRDQRVTFKLTDAEMEALQSDAEREGLPVPVYARALVLRRNEKPRK